MKKIPGLRLLVAALVLLPGLTACEVEKEEQKEPTVLQVYGGASCNALDKKLTLSVQCDLNWTATIDDADWAKVENENVITDGTGSVTLRLETNRGDDDRSATLTITSGTKSVSKTITQKGLAQFFQPREVHLAGTAESTVSFQSPSEWTASVTEGADWILLKNESGESGATKVAMAAVDANENVGDRSGSVMITIGGEEFTIPVYQKQKDVILADGTSVEFDYTGGDFVVVTQSNIEYTIETSADWVHHTETKALNTASEYFIVDKNGAADQRSATITFTGSDNPSVKISITVKQGGMDPILYLETPGAYGIEGNYYVLGKYGWNLSSHVTAADGSREYRLFNQATLQVARITGYDLAAEKGTQCQIRFECRKKANLQFVKTYNATVLESGEELLWLKVDDSICFIIQK